MPRVRREGHHDVRGVQNVERVAIPEPLGFHDALERLSESVSVQVRELQRRYDFELGAKNGKKLAPVVAPADEFICCSNEPHFSVRPEIELPSSDPCSPRHVRRIKTELSRAKSLVVTDPPDSCVVGKRPTLSEAGTSESVLDRSWLERLVMSGGFEVTFAVIIMFNLLIMVLECQFLGVQLGYEVGFPEYEEPAYVRWPWAEGTLRWMEYMIGFAFTVEVILKLMVLRWKFFKMGWNLFDSFVIIFWLVSLLGSMVMLNPMMLRRVRVVRIMRILRLVRTFQVFDVLRLLIGAIRSSVVVLLWTFLLLTLIMMSSALALNFVLKEVVISNDLAPAKQKTDVFMYFGSFSRSFLTMVELTLGNWVPVTRLLHEISEWTALFFLFYQATVTFACLNVIRAIFIHETMKVASFDDELMVLEKERQSRKHLSQMKALLKEGDESGDGYLDFDEFVDVMSDKRVRTWMAAMQVEVRDPAAMFNLMDNWDGRGASEAGSAWRLSITELSQGLARLKGPARSVDLVTLMYDMRVLVGEVECLRSQMARLAHADDVDERPLRPSMALDEADARAAWPRDTA